MESTKNLVFAIFIVIITYLLFIFSFFIIGNKKVHFKMKEAGKIKDSILISEKEYSQLKKVDGLYGILSDSITKLNVAIKKNEELINKRSTQATIIKKEPAQKEIDYQELDRLKFEVK